MYQIIPYYFFYLQSLNNMNHLYNEKVFVLKHFDVLFSVKIKLLFSPYKESNFKIFVFFSYFSVLNLVISSSLKLLFI